MSVGELDANMSSVSIGGPAVRRLRVLGRILHRLEHLHLNKTSAGAKSFSVGSHVTIGDVTKDVKEPTHPEYVPKKYLEEQVPQDQLRHLRWMLQKDVLGQDMFLLGRPGPQRRRLALQFLQATCRELEFVSLSRDTTESDLKQRREIRAGTATYFDQSAVRAAVEGRILVLEGIEKAERNVLPVLNNLLENREMHLEDGRFLVPASRYDKLLQDHSREELDQWQLVRVSEDFRVIALGIPVPRYLGNPLDPPLRSRFQARDIGLPNFKEQEQVLRSAVPSVDPGRVTQLLSCCYALLSKESAQLGLPDFPLDNLVGVVPLLEQFPAMHIHEVMYRLYPYRSFLGKEGRQAVEDVLHTFSITTGSSESPASIQVIEVTPENHTAAASISYDGQKADVEVLCGSAGRLSPPRDFVPTPYQDQLLARMLQTHLVHDICLIGPRGCGKSATVHLLANILGYHMEPIVLYQDMTSRDLIQQRNTLPSGDTVWQHSPLITAALEGKMAVLDGIHRVHSSTLTVISRLVQDRELQLYDGHRLLRHDRYDKLKSQHGLSDDKLKQSGVLRIHPSFRIVALAEPPALGGGGPQWLTPELLSMFIFHEMRPLALSEELHIVKTLHEDVPPTVRSVMELAHQLRNSADPTLVSLAGSLSTRQLLRVARRMARFPSDDPVETIHRACLARFLPSLAREALDAAMAKAGIHPVPRQTDQNLLCEVDGDKVTIGRTTVQRYHTTAESKVPDILFFNVPQHVWMLEALLQDFSLGEHLLLVGNQGVGKNKLADRLLQLLHRPREYIQLHRDTTVQTLTAQPAVRGGVVVYEDSPLVQAARLGHILVVDEADKAPTHVTCILKTLVETGEMILSDGRRIVPLNDPRAHSATESIIPVHPDFRMIVLANRPGFPFLGNDFFAALGDLFSCHTVDNPSMQSELSLLRQYGPSVPQPVIERLVKAFGELRMLADQGLVQYPYSTREVVNIVRHLEEFPSESLSSVVRNVFDFDSYSPEVQDTLQQTLHKHGIPIGADPSNVKLAKEFPLPAMRHAGDWTVVRSREPVVLPAECRMLKCKPAIGLQQYQHLLDKMEARASSFSEMLSYWSVPLHEGSVVATAAISKSKEGDPLNDVIYVLASNPLSLYTMMPSGEGITELSLQGLFRPQRGARPQYTLAPVGGTTSLLVHEKTSNTLVLVDAGVGQATPIPLHMPLECAAQSLSRALGAAPALTWHLLPQLLDVTPTVVLFASEGSKVEVVNLESLSAVCLSMPFPVGLLHLAAVDKWLVEDMSGQKHVLAKRQPEDPCPTVLQDIQETSDLPGPISSCALGQLEGDLLSRALGQSVSAPHRVLSTENSFATIVLGFPELDHSSNEVYVWPRRESLSGSSVTLLDQAQVVRAVPTSVAPREAYSERGQHSGLSGFLEVSDLANNKLRYIPVPQPLAVSPVAAWMYQKAELPLHLVATSHSGLATVDAGGCIRLWETGLANLEQSLLEWRKMIGSKQEYLQLTVESPSGKDVTAPKYGKVDEKGDPHVGGNTWAGGTGGRDTAGLGGKGGPYRLDAGHKVHQVSQAEKDAVPEHVKKAAHDMAQRAFKNRLREIQMSQYDAKLYEQFSAAVRKQVQALRVILGSLQAKSKERQWLRHQTSGELDDTKLIEGLTGERNVYRRRAEAPPELGTPQMKPKRLRLVVDVSGSMYRFNSYDGRLDREMEAVVMVMEAFEGHEGRIQYDIVGHSGESSQIVFVSHDSPPADNKQSLDIIKTMHAHSQFCLSGDNTLEATQQAISNIGSEDCDEAIVVVLSDANFDRYGIPPQQFAHTLTADTKVNAYAIFIGSLGDQATRLTGNLPSGRAFVCLDLKDIPQILQQVFSASVLNTR